jgi:hypothetical protein
MNKYPVDETPPTKNKSKLFLVVPYSLWNNNKTETNVSIETYRKLVVRNAVYFELILAILKFATPHMSERESNAKKLTPCTCASMKFIFSYKNNPADIRQG